MQSKTTPQTKIKMQIHHFSEKGGVGGQLMGSLIPKAEHGVLIPKEISACFQMQDSAFDAPKKSAVTMVVKWVVFLGAYIQKLRRGSGHPVPRPSWNFRSLRAHIYTCTYKHTQAPFGRGPPSQNKILAVPLQCFKQMQKYSILTLGLCCLIQSTNLVRVSNISSLLKLLPTAEHWKA